MTDRQSRALRAQHLRELYFAGEVSIDKAVAAQPEELQASVWDQRFTSRERCYDEDNKALSDAHKRGER